MSKTCVEQLLAIGGPALGHGVASAPLIELDALLEMKDGFYAFESALHVFPRVSNEQHVGLLDWNSNEYWRFSYEDLAEGCYFFAEDIFGGQFCEIEGSYYYFDPETGARELVGDSLEKWARAILSDSEYWTGFRVAHRWQSRKGPIPSGKRLVPKIPFVAGGAYELDNLYLSEAASAMRFRGELAVQIRDVPDGAAIQLKVE